MGKTDVDKLREVYDRMDKNDDGTVTYHELKQCIMESQGCTDDEADGILHVSPILLLSTFHLDTYNYCFFFKV